jgi:uncharacterized protein YdhG (YjbR/CyaY superfamily)
MAKTTQTAQKAPRKTASPKKTATKKSTTKATQKAPQKAPAPPATSKAKKLQKEADVADSAAVDAYLAAVPEPLRSHLQTLRETIKAAAPVLTERVSYKIPIFEHGGHVCAIAAFKAHGSLVVMNAELVAMEHQALVKAKLTANGTTIRFTPEHPIPTALVKRLVKARLAENQALYAG